MKFRKMLMLTLALLGLAVYAYAQTPVPPAPTDKLDITFLLGTGGAVLTYLVTFGAKKLLPTLPKIVVLAVPLVFGGLLTFVYTAQSHQVAGSLQYLALGALAVLIDNVLKYVQNPT